MAELIVRELDTGAIHLQSCGGVRVFEPNFDFERALASFEAFSKKYSDRFYDEEFGIDWFPAIQYFLFHKVFWPYVLYKDPLEIILNHRGRVRFGGKNRLYVLYSILRPSGWWARLSFELFTRFERVLVFVHNRWIFRSVENLLFRYSANDFRIADIVRAMAERCDDVVFAVGSGFGAECRHFFDRNYFCVLINRYHAQGVEDFEQSALGLAATLVKQSKRQFLSYLKIFRSHPRLRRFLGVDDTLYLFPLLFAANRSNIQTIGFQHGLYGKNQIGYSVTRAHKFEWFQWLVVWDDFWRDVFLANNKFFSKERVISGIASESLNFELSSNPRNRVILCIYDQFLDVNGYVFYLRKLMANNFSIIIKLRPGVGRDQVVLEYGLSPGEVEKIEFAQRIDVEILNRVSIIAGAKSGLLYNLLSVHRPLWIFETKYHYLSEVMKLPEVTVISADKMDGIEQIYKESLIAGGGYAPSRDVTTVEQLFSLVDRYG